MVKKSDHFDGERFFNPGLGGRVKSLWSVLQWKLKGGAAKWPRESHRKVVADRRTILSGQVRFTWIGHATYLIESQGMNILTDPVYSLRTSPSQWVGPKRVVAPGIPFDELPRIHVVIVSHDHYDHMDKLTLQRLEEKFQPRFIVPLGNKKRLESWGCRDVLELDWWQKGSGGGVAPDFTLVPAQHWSGRGLGDRLKTLWGGFVFTLLDRVIFFAGDTGYGPHFFEVSDRLGRIDVALLPIGAYEPRWFMKLHHMNPEDAVRAHKDLKAKQSLGMHFGTFQLTDEPIDAPIEHLSDALKKAELPPDVFLAPKIGESFLL